MTNYLDTMLRFIDKMNSTIVACPKCGHEQDLSEIDYAEHYVTMWGEDGPQKYECGECDYVMLVQETVSRSFDIVENKE